jgi:hypothetical protein
MGQSRYRHSQAAILDNLFQSIAPIVHSRNPNSLNAIRIVGKTFSGLLFCDGENVISGLIFVNTVFTLRTVNTNSASNNPLTNPHAAVTDGDMKDKWLQVRVDDAIEQMLLDLRKVEDDLPGKSAMVIRLIERAHAKLKAGNK